uniref:RING/U-box superfamily protein n=1 Tax=Helianthus annuus TaxID=4232 RepID=A0A251U4E2_HELAN
MMLVQERLFLEHANVKEDGVVGYQQSSPPSSSGAKISPAVLFIIIILAVLFFISGLLHLLVRFLTKHQSSSNSQRSNRFPDGSPSAALQRQLQQLFHLHDSGLDQTFIDALPVFMYKEVVGANEPFDCAVCLCENTLFDPGFSIDNPMFEYDDPREPDESGIKTVENEQTLVEKGVFSVRLGKFRKLSEGDTYLRVPLRSRRDLQDAKFVKNVEQNERIEDRTLDEDMEGKKINIGAKTDSFSVSKIWLWSKKRKFASSDDNQMHNPSSVDMELPRIGRFTRYMIDDKELFF